MSTSPLRVVSESPLFCVHPIGWFQPHVIRTWVPGNAIACCAPSHPRWPACTRKARAGNFMSLCERAISNKTPLRQLTRGTLTASRRGSNRARLVRVPLPDKRTEGFEKLQAMLTRTHPNPARPPISQPWMRDALCSRGCTGEERESCPAAGAGGHPPHGHVVHRMRKPSRSGTHSRRPGVAQPEEGQLFSSSRPAASSSAQLPDQPCAGHRPGHARCSTQHGGSDHRRPSNTGTPTPSPISPQNTRVSRKLYSSLHRGRLGR